MHLDASLPLPVTTTLWRAVRSVPTLRHMGLDVLALVGSSVTLAALTLPAVARLVLPVPRETRLADHLPLQSLASDRRTLICRDGSLVQCLRVEGRDVMFLGAGERDHLFRLRKRWLEAMAELGVTVRVVVVRQRAAAAIAHGFEQPMLAILAKSWGASFESAFRNQQIIVLSVPGKSRSAAARLAEAVDSSLQILDPYHPHIMSQPDDPAGLKDPNHLLAFWAGLASPITRPTPVGGHHDIAESLTADTVEFSGDSGVIAFRRGDEQRFVAAIGIRRFGDTIDEQMIADFASLGCETVLLHVAEPWSRALASLKLAQEGRMSAVSRLGSGGTAQFDAALDLLDGLDEHRSSFANYAMVALLIADKREDLALYDADLRKICAAYGATAVREGGAAQASWFLQFPSYPIWPRKFRFFSSNMACAITLDRAPSGLTRCDWGEGPLTQFRTVGGTPYAFQLHVSSETDAVAHAVCIGPTGSGKTTVMSFLAGMAMRHPRLQVYIFDRFHGAYVFTTAVGGRYLNLATGDGCGLNPFQCADTPGNRAFLRLWLRGLAGCDDPEALEEIAMAVETAFDGGLPLDVRSLATLFDPCFSAGGPIKHRLQRWIDPNLYGAIFNAPRDTLDIRENRLVTFDMTDLFKDELLAQATLSYLMHRIQTRIEESNAPAFIFIDETEPMLRNPMFRSYYVTMLQEYRKRGAAVISAFQRPEAIAQAGMGEAIRGQCQTVFFFPNPQARPEDYADWSLTDREWAYIKGGLPGAKRLRRSVLVKRASGESVVLDTDLSPLGSYLKLFASGREAVAAARDCQKNFGAEWVEHYVGAA